MTKRRVCLLLAVVLLSAACAGDPAPPQGTLTAQLTMGGCVWEPKGHDGTDGLTSIRNSGHSSLTITRVGLDGAKNARAVRAEVIPLLDGGGYGYNPVWPPNRYGWGKAAKLRGMVWSRLGPATGAKLAPGKSFDVLVEIQVTGHQASIPGIYVSYWQGGASHTLRVHTPLTIIQGTSCAS